MCESGARSPLAPSEPISGMAGVIPRLRYVSSRVISSGRTAEQPLARALSRAVRMARDSIAENSGPTPALWLRTRLVCSSTSFDGSPSHAVDGHAVADDLLELLPAEGRRVERVLRDRAAGAPFGDPADVLSRQRGAVERDPGGVPIRGGHAVHPISARRQRSRPP